MKKAIVLSRLQRTTFGERGIFSSSTAIIARGTFQGYWSSPIRPTKRTSGDSSWRHPCPVGPPHGWQTTSAEIALRELA